MVEAGDRSWLVLIYRVPSEPTRHRAMLWRRLRNLGAIYLQHSAVALPHTDEHERALRALRAEIVQRMEGKAYLLSAAALAGETDLVATLNAARDDEYDEILDKCADFHAGLAKEVTAEHFTYGELEENEEDLAKLMRWYDKVKARDLLQARRGADVETALQDCARALEEFAAQVYAADADS